MNRQGGRLVHKATFFNNQGLGISDELRNVRGWMECLRELALRQKNFNVVPLGWSVVAHVCLEAIELCAGLRFCRRPKVAHLRRHRGSACAVQTQRRTEAGEYYEVLGQENFGQQST